MRSTEPTKLARSVRLAHPERSPQRNVVTSGRRTATLIRGFLRGGNEAFVSLVAKTKPSSFGASINVMPPLYRKARSNSFSTSLASASGAPRRGSPPWHRTSTRCLLVSFDELGDRLIPRSASSQRSCILHVQHELGTRLRQMFIRLLGRGSHKIRRRARRRKCWPPQRYSFSSQSTKFAARPASARFLVFGIHVPTGVGQNS